MLTEEQIETRVCRMYDVLDKRYLNSDMSEQEYDLETQKIKEWADLQYSRLPQSTSYNPI